MKVRARVKTQEHWPEWTRCCAEMIAHAEMCRNKMPEVFEVNTSAVFDYPVKVCKFCGAGIDVKKAVLVVGLPYFAALEWLDLDEGPSI